MQVFWQLILSLFSCLKLPLSHCHLSLLVIEILVGHYFSLQLFKDIIPLPSGFHPFCDILTINFVAILSVFLQLLLLFFLCVWFFSSLIQMNLSCFLFVFCYLMFGELLDLWIDIFCQFRKVLEHYWFKYCFCPILSPLFLEIQLYRLKIFLSLICV